MSQDNRPDNGPSPAKVAASFILGMIMFPLAFLAAGMTFAFTSQGGITIISVLLSGLAFFLILWANFAIIKRMK